MRTTFLRGMTAALISVAAPGVSFATIAPAKAVMPGMQVVDVAGQPVGTVQSVRGNELILKTDRHEVRLPVSSFTPDKGKLLFGMSRQALNRATDAMLANALLPGSEVRGKDGQLAGHIEALGQNYVTLELLSGEVVRLPRDSVAPGAKSAVLGITVAELQQLAKQALVATP